MVLPLLAVGAIEALPELVKLGSDLLGTIDHPAAKTATAALDGVTQAIAHNEIKPEDLADANAHLEAMAQIDAQKETDQSADQATTQRAELASGDKYVSRMRPTWGYAMAFTWTLQAIGVSFLMFWNPAMAIQVIAALSQLTGLWGIALAVLGVHFYGRTQEKKAEMTGNPSAIQSVPQVVGSLVGTAWDAVTRKLPQ